MRAAALLRARDALVFDLDGTLVDSAGDIGHVLRLALADCGLEAAAASALPDLHSPLEGIVRGLLGADTGLAVHAGAVVDAYRRGLAQSRYEHAAPYPGAVNFLRACAGNGKRLAVCTNKRHAEALRMLEHFDMLQYFDSVVGTDSTDFAKPHGAPLLMALDTLDAECGDAVLVGDTHVDALCARNAGVDFIWHTRGYGREEVARVGCAARFEAFDELLAPSLTMLS